jgi:N-acetylglutamate synthase-like GNAT family acetyltransferase
MSIFHPQTSAQREQRDVLLASSLRPDGSPFPIAAEYPLVLGESGTQYSFCLGEPEAPLAHANLWPRRLISQTHDVVLTVGLIGNVATSSDHRGQGLMRTLFSELKSAASAQGLEGLVLWSDLVEFYQKLGFKSCGSELRWQFSRDKLRSLFLRQSNFAKIKNLSTHEAQRLLSLRYPVPFTLDRSPQEFQTLTKIPEVTLLASGHKDATYVILGKGCDMTCVVHEWGAPSAEALLMGVLAAAETADLPEIVLLTPKTLAQSWCQKMRPHAVAYAKHSMALSWWPDHSRAPDPLASSFIWGLDSI